MNIKVKKNTHFLNLLEDRKLADSYFYGKNMADFNSIQLSKLQENYENAKKKYNQKLKNNDLASKVEHERRKVMSSIRDLDTFESNLAYLIISGNISHEQYKQLGFDSEYIKKLLEKYKKMVSNSHIEYDYDEQRRTTAEIMENGKSLILPYTPTEVRREIKK